MEATRFDRLVRSLALASRRQVLKALAGATFSGLIVRGQAGSARARQDSLPCPPCLPCETCDGSVGQCLSDCGDCAVCDPTIGDCRPCAACEICDEFTRGQCVPQCKPCETCDPGIGSCRPCEPSLCETCDQERGGCRACARCEKCDPNSGACLPTCQQCETCDPVLDVCRGCDPCRCEECDPTTGQCRGCDRSRCERCDLSSGRCVEGCSACERCDPNTGACIPGCEQCQECDPVKGACRDCLRCEECDQQTGRCVARCEKCQVCDPELGDCRPCQDDLCEVCDEVTGQCLSICCPGEPCEPGRCRQMAENCLEFKEDGPNPRLEVVGGIPVIFDIYWPPGRPVPPYVRATSSRVVATGASLNGLETGFLMTITLHQPVAAVELTLTHSASPARVAAFAGSVQVDAAAMDPGLGGALQTLRLEGAGIDYLVVTAPQDEAYLTKFCVCPSSCQAG